MEEVMDDFEEIQQNAEEIADYFSVTKSKYL